MDIIGVDFSGADNERKTWIARGVSDGTTLTLESCDCERITRQELTDILKGIKRPVVAAMDFPFSVPRPFAKELAPGASMMSQVWKAVSMWNYDEFDKKRNAFVEAHGEMKRQGDAHHPGCFSPLHKVNPNMVPMTFYGMKMLNELGPLGFCIPPLSTPKGDSPHNKSTLLEIMPGAIIRSLCLPDKGYKRGEKWKELRREILASLASLSHFDIKGLDALHPKCLVKTGDDCLDAIVAAVAAAMWHRGQSCFECQPSDSDEVAKLEGWLYCLCCQRPALHK